MPTLYLISGKTVDIVCSIKKPHKCRVGDMVLGEFNEVVVHDAYTSTLEKTGEAVYIMGKRASLVCYVDENKSILACARGDTGYAIYLTNLAKKHNYTIKEIEVPY